MGGWLWFQRSTIVMVAALSMGCSGKHRPFATGEEGQAAGGASTQAEGSLLPTGESGTPAVGLPDDVSLRPAGSLGTECAVDSGCDSGFCVGGRCCDQACDGVCEACSPGGSCDMAPPDDPRCPAITCAAPQTACATFPEAQSTNRCEAPGLCKTACDPLTIAVDTACGEVAPGIPGVCSATGDCVDPRGSLGTACESDVQCAEGRCVDGVCCAEACTAACESCDLFGACVADAPGVSCGDGLQCFGRGACLAPNGSACQVGSDCGSGICGPGVGGGTVCCAEPCGDGLLCNGSGECISADADLGAPCSDDSQCIGGRCFDGVCCDSECSGVCEQCNAPGQAGRCSAAPTGTADPSCEAGRQCAGRGQCLLPLGATCTLNGDCQSGECGAALAGNGEVCCETICANGQRCSPAGSCVDAPRPNGSSCALGTECQSGTCLNGSCCESSCNGICEACSALGVCNLSPGNDARCPPVDCPTSDSVCVSYPPAITTNLCAAFGACRSSEQSCQPSFASRGTPCEAVAPGVTGACDGAGTCTDPRVGLGVACSTATECRSGNCVDGVCCDAACDGICEACGTNGLCSFRDTGSCPPGQQCATRTTCSVQTVAEGASCANGEACAAGGCVNGVCLGLCRLAAAGSVEGSRYDACVIGP